jgi:peptide/nickel transport system permease protein
MWKFIGKRLIQMTLLFVIFLTLVFLLLQAQPGDITSQFLNPNIPAEARAQIAERLGLGGSVIDQWWNYITNFFQGNLGVSFGQYPTPVIEVIGERLPRTLFLFSFSTLLAYWMGFVLGKRLAWRRGGWSEHAVTVGGVLLYTVFYPWFAIIMILIFASGLGWFPINGFLTPEFWRNVPYTGNEVFTRLIITISIAALAAAVVVLVAKRQDEHSTARNIKRGGLGVVAVVFGWYWLASPMRPFAADIVHHAILPIITLALIAFAGIMLLTRSSMLETLREDYILTAQAKGVPSRLVRDRHASRIALLPVVTSFVLGLAFVIGGGVVTETVFSWPGMGALLLSATVAEDVPVAVGALAFIGILALVAHLIVDLLYSVLDPRIRFQSNS